ncbi:MAG: hypothetical protein FWH08_04495 [Oscillospiraceae bacterium]|nr:hypothetical protein [Oscillospiraceae bacterium]
METSRLSSIETVNFDAVESPIALGIPPVFSSTEKIEKPKKTIKSLTLYRIMTVMFLISAFIVLKHFFPEVYIVADLWLSEKLNLTSLSL